MQSQKYFSIIPKQERIQDLAQGGGTNRKIFCPPPWAPELLRRGTILRGGDSPPLKLLRGGQSPIPPPLYPLLYLNTFAIWSNLARHKQ